jgi:hypothetical protein
VLCSRAFRSSVPSNVPPASMARRMALAVVPLPMLMAELVRRVWGDGPSGRGQFTRVILTGWVLMLALAALAALGQSGASAGHITS